MRHGQDGRDPDRGRMVAAFWRTLALVAALTLLGLLLVFAAAQGALDGDPTTLRYWARWWPVWLLSAPVVPALIAGVAGRAGPSLAWSGAILLLACALVLTRSFAAG